KQSHSDVKYEENCFIVFGKETKGLPEPLLKANMDTCIRVPMLDFSLSMLLSHLGLLKLPHIWVSYLS
ncbi:hypothetical protein ACTPEM_26200, partial [Clostridioides difficile]